MPLIPASIPTVTDPIPSETYDGWFLFDLKCQGGDPNNVMGVAILRKARVRPDGTIEYSPSGEMLTVSLGSLTESADPAVQQAVMAVMQACVSQATAQGIVL
jgi:hypothetical protein